MTCILCSQPALVVNHSPHPQMDPSDGEDQMGRVQGVGGAVSAGRLGARRKMFSSHALCDPPLLRLEGGCCPKMSTYTFKESGGELGPSRDGVHPTVGGS